MDKEFVYLVLSIVEEIPCGKVASYSQIAKLAGYPKNARKVGKTLSHAEYFGKFPCHRVVHADGKLVVGWQEQKQLLISEGVFFKNSNTVDMKVSRWDKD